MFKCLIAEDDSVCRKLLFEYLKDYVQCDFAINGKEAIDAYENSIETNKPYDFICLDIMMPMLSGQDVLRKIRRFEDKKNVQGLDRVKVIMTTALDDSVNIMGAFNTGCEAYLVKPITKQKLSEQLNELGIGIDILVCE